MAEFNLKKNTRSFCHYIAVWARSSSTDKRLFSNHFSATLSS